MLSPKKTRSQPCAWCTVPHDRAFKSQKKTLVDSLGVQPGPGQLASSAFLFYLLFLPSFLLISGPPSSFSPPTLFLTSFLSSFLSLFLLHLFPLFRFPFSFILVTLYLHCYLITMNHSALHHQSKRSNVQNCGIRRQGGVSSPLLQDVGSGTTMI